VADPNIFILPPPGTVAWDDEEALDSTDSYKSVIDHLKKVVEQRRLDCWPPFKDYDKLSHGHVTKKQFHQALTKVNLHLSDREVAVLEAKFMNNKGFNYQEFLGRVQSCEKEKESAKYQDLKNELNRLNSVKAVYESKPLCDVQSILLKLKDLVFRRRISIYEWLRDHDKLNSGRLLKETFRRAINLCNLDIEQSEIEYIMD
jgi:predicted DNA binding CopG/RHH family protein